jgi:hypothetical protein
VIGEGKEFQNSSFDIWFKATFSTACLAMQAGILREMGYLLVQIEVNLLHLLDQLFYAQSVSRYELQS